MKDPTVLMQPCEHLHSWHSLISEDVTVCEINLTRMPQFRLHYEKKHLVTCVLHYAVIGLMGMKFYTVNFNQSVGCLCKLVRYLLSLSLWLLSCCVRFTCVLVFPQRESI